MKPLLASTIRAARLRKIQPFLTGSVLDLGCGLGDLLPLLAAGQEYAGVDINAEVIRQMRAAQPNSLFAVCDLDHEDLQLNRTFDTVVMCALIEHLAFPDRLVGSIRRHLKQGGKVVLTTPTPFGNRVHRLGAHLGLFYIEAALDHKIIYDQAMLTRLFSGGQFTPKYYKTFQLSCNQVFVASRA